MATKTLEKIRQRRKVARTAEPTWDIALLYPNQGNWRVDEYLALDGHRLVELKDGVLEVLPVPTTTHQLLLVYLYRALSDFALAGKLGHPVDQLTDCGVSSLNVLIADHDDLRR